MRRDMETATERVEIILEFYPDTRDSDKLLWLRYLEKFTELKNIIGDKAYQKMSEIVMLPDTPVMESVSRARRLIQSKGKFLGTVTKERRDEQEAMRKWGRDRKKSRKVRQQIEDSVKLPTNEFEF